MNGKNKKGFTLIELLAVIVILAIITLLAFTKIRDYLIKSDQKSAETNAKIFVKAVNDMASMSMNEDVVYYEGKYSVHELKSSGKLKVNGTLPSSGYVILNDFDVDSACLIIGKYSIEFENGSLKKSTLKGKCAIEVEPVVFAYTGSYETFTATETGNYKIELWGAQGITTDVVDKTYGDVASGGKGGYTSGIIHLNENDKLYIYVGGSGNHNGYNGGGSSGSGAGGGATDVRLVSGEWNNSESLSSRIMVAAGGGGAASGIAQEVGGAAGGLSGVRGANHTSYNGGGYGGTQTQGGSLGNTSPKGATSGTFGIGGNGGAESGYGYGGAGGGGYYGGGGGSCNEGAGGGGSSYISGFTGCVAITSSTSLTPKSGCTDGTTNNSCSVHYSSKKFTDGVIKSGNDIIPTHDGESIMTGNSGDGYAKITLIDDASTPTGFAKTFPGYTKVEYIESTGTQYIDTGFIPKTNTKIELEVSFNGTFKNYSSYGGSNCFMGVVDSNSKWFSFNFGDEANQSNQFYSWVDTTSQSTVDITLTDNIRTTKNTFTVQNGTISYATINKSIAAKTNNQDTSMYLFASNAKEYDYNTPFTSYNMRVYGMKIYEGTTLVKELIPCYSSSSVGLCDMVTKTFYGNSGTGTFNKGSDVN